MKKLAIITTHPIQYQIPLFKDLKKNKIDAHIFFASKHGLNIGYKDPEFLVKFKWNTSTDLLKGYKSYFPKKQKYKINDFRLNFPQIEKDLKKENFDAILVLGWNNFHYIRAIIFAKKNNKKLILRAENNLQAKNSFLKKIIKKFIFRFFFTLFDNFLYIGKLNKKFYLHYGVKKKKLFYAPYFIDNKFFDIKINKKKIKNKLNLSSKKIVLFVGKLIQRKKPFEFLQLAKKNLFNKKIHFIMIGDGILKKNCKQFIIKNNLRNLSLIGFVNQKKLREYYKISDLFILTSEYETWGLTINEALASGVPVICTKNCGSSNDLITNKKIGYTYELGNISDLSNKMNQILFKRKLFKNFKVIAKKKISNFSKEKTILSLKDIINEKK